MILRGVHRLHQPTLKVHEKGRGPLISVFLNLGAASSAPYRALHCLLSFSSTVEFKGLHCIKFSQGPQSRLEFDD